MTDISPIDSQAVLTSNESVRFTELEGTIERGIKTFVDVGNALAEIRDSRLYREQYGTFETYCRERWGMAYGYARYLIDAASVTDNLHHGEGCLLPANERQARPLAQLEPEQQREAWQRAVETAPDGRITAAHVQRVADLYREPKENIVYGTAGRYYLRNNGVKECAECGQLWGADIDYCPYCNISPEGRIAHVQKERHNDIERLSNIYQPVEATIFSSRSEEYDTPSHILEIARSVLGQIDLDPASNEEAQKNVQAVAYYTKEQDGLKQEWNGKVWLNPPYGKTEGRSNQELWSQRLKREYLDGNVTEAILLVKAAVGYKWFEELFRDWPVCFLRERLSFILEDGNDEGQSKQGTALFYFGNNFMCFATAFRGLGRIIPPEDELNATLFR